MSGDYSWLSHFDLGLNWAVIIKWLPKLAQGATLTLELVAIAVTEPVRRLIISSRARLVMLSPKSERIWPSHSSR